MELTLEEKVELLVSVCEALGRERKKYSLIETLTEKEINDFCKELKMENIIDKDRIKSRIERLEKLKNRLKE